MRITPTALPEVLLIEPKVFGDDRGFFMETWRADAFAQAGVTAAFVQDNHSRSAAGVLRGLHWQRQRPQGKLARVTAGAVFDVAVDLRRSSPRFGRWVGYELNADNKRQIWVPPGFGHGFLVLSDGTDFLYKCTDYYMPEDERALAWNDQGVGIAWPLAGTEPQLSEKDRAAPGLAEADAFA